MKRGNTMCIVRNEYQNAIQCMQMPYHVRMSSLLPPSNRLIPTNVFPSWIHKPHIPIHPFLAKLYNLTSPS